MRMQGVEKRQGPLWQRLLFGVMERRKGGIPAPLLIYGWRPKIMRAFLGLGKSVRAPGELPERLKRLAMYWTARQVECAF